MTKLTVCGLMDNDEAHIERFFHALRNVVDEVILGDLGCTDKTTEIAKRFNAKIITIPKDADFSQARNLLLEKATSDWILILDADEIIHNFDLHSLKKFLKKDDTSAFILNTRNYTNNKEIMGWLPCKEIRGFNGFFKTHTVRLFKKDKNLQFKYKVNETVLPSLLKLRKKLKRINDLIVHKYGWEHKNHSYLPLLEQQIKELPKDYKARYDLAKAYMSKKDFSSAYEHFQKIKNKNPGYKNTLVHLGSLALIANDNFKAAKFLMRAIDVNPNNITAYHNLGMIFRKAGKHDRAEWCFKKALFLNQNQPSAIRLLALTYKDQNKNQEAKDLINKALRLFPNNPTLMKTKEVLN